MSKTKLLLEYDYDFLLFGIISRIPDYKLSWFINNALEINLVKDQDLQFVNHTKHNANDLTLGFDSPEDSAAFSFYRFENELEHLSYTLVANRSGSSMLIKEEQSVDFFLIIGGIYDEVDTEQLMDKLRLVQDIIAVFEIDPNRLKSKQNLLFD